MAALWTEGEQLALKALHKEDICCSLDVKLQFTIRREGLLSACLACPLLTDHMLNQSDGKV